LRTLHHRNEQILLVRINAHVRDNVFTVFTDLSAAES
jgi:hypothetical protein